MDLNKLTSNQRVSLLGAALGAIALFLPWRTASADSVSAFDSGLLAWGGLLLAIAAATILVVHALEIIHVKLGQVSPEQLAFALSTIGSLMIVARRLTSGNVEFGLYVGILAAAVVVYGTYTAMKEAGHTIPTPRDFRGNRSH